MADKEGQGQGQGKRSLEARADAFSRLKKKFWKFFSIASILGDTAKDALFKKRLVFSII